jgi:hypothetical protein
VSESGGLAAVAESASWFDDMFGSLSAADQYQFVVNGPEASPLKDVSVTNLQGWIPGAGGVNTEGQILPTIAIVSYYDTFAVAPVRYITSFKLIDISRCRRVLMFLEAVLLPF